GEVAPLAHLRVKPADQGFVKFAKPAGDRGQAAFNLLGGFQFQVVVEQYYSRKRKRVNREEVICCSMPSSSTRNSFLCRSSTSLPLESFTVTRTTTKS